MRDVLVLCEGHTEREFCRSVVAPHAALSRVWLAGTLVGKPQKKRGGITKWSVYRQKLLRLARERNDRHVGVLVDYYAMPDSWPGRVDAKNQPPEARGAHVEKSLRNDLAGDLGDRFHPCVQLHEFESLLFVEPETSALSLAVAGAMIEPKQLAGQLSEIVTKCGGSVELINDSSENAPSKRICRLIPSYDKVAWGVTATIDIELDTLRAGCPWLDRWMKELEALGTN